MASRLPLMKSDPRWRALPARVRVRRHQSSAVTEGAIMAEKKKLVTAVFRDPVNAQRAHDALRRRGYTDTEINVLMSDKTRSTYFSGEEPGKIKAGTMATEGMGVGGAIGTAVGATVAAIAFIGSNIFVPGLGF